MENEGRELVPVTGENEGRRAVAISRERGGVVFENVAQLIEFAKVMSRGGIAIPEHLRDNPGACAAVTMQAVEWGMTPFAVANKSYSVNNRLAYEAQLVHAVIQTRAPIRGRITSEVLDRGPHQRMRVWAELRDRPGVVVDYMSPPLDRIAPKKSPLWTTDTDQQQHYYSVRAFSRKNFPEVLLGIYVPDELDDAPDPGRSGSSGPRRVIQPFEDDIEGDFAHISSAVPHTASVPTVPASSAESVVSGERGDPSGSPAPTAPLDPLDRDPPPDEPQTAELEPALSEAFDQGWTSKIDGLPRQPPPHFDDYERHDWFAGYDHAGRSP